MKKTKQQLITGIRGKISQTDSANSQFDDTELLEFLNNGIQYVASLIDWPRDHFEIQVEEGKPAYNLPSDSLRIKTAYFGKQDEANDTLPLDITTEEGLAEKVPGWLDQTSGARGRPSRIILLNRRHMLIHPTPNADESVTGKKLYVGYIYYPARLVSDGEYPDLPDAYHEFSEDYAAHLCFMGKLKEYALGQAVLKTLVDKVKSVQPQVTTDSQQLDWVFGNYDNTDSPSYGDDLANGYL